MESPILRFENNDIIIEIGGWNAQNPRFFDPKSISKWTVYVFDDSIQFNQISGFVQELKKTAIGHGITINDPVDIFCPDYSEWGRDSFRFLENEIKKINSDFIMAILQDRSPWLTLK